MSWACDLGPPHVSKRAIVVQIGHQSLVMLRK